MVTNIYPAINKEPIKTLLPNDRILRWPDVQQRVGICRSQAHLLISKSRFPAQVKLGPRASGWIESEIIAWIEQRIAESRTNDIDTA